jgi:hypothetical protein
MNVIKYIEKLQEKIQKNSYKKNIIIITIIIVIILIIYNCLFFLGNIIKKKEPFQQNTLSPDSIKDFLKLQNTINRQTNFDVEKLSQQVTQKELDTFIKTGLWPWSQTVIDLYTNAINKNVFIRNDPKESIQYARNIYNENAILEILSSQTKEGQFLINGITLHNNAPNPQQELPSGFGSFGYKSGLVTKLNDVIKCNIDPYNNNSHLEKIHYTGKGGIFNQQTKIVTPLDYHNLESEIPGFTFTKQPCNPCKVFDNPSDYSCPFELNLSVKNKNKNRNKNRNKNKISSGISSIWKYLWNI